jgi:hypothetical protein
VGVPSRSSHQSFAEATGFFQRLFLQLGMRTTKVGSSNPFIILPALDPEKIDAASIGPQVGLV